MSVPGMHCDPSQALGSWVTSVLSIVPVSLLALDVGSLQAVSPRCVEAKLPVPEPVSPELQRTVSNLCKMSEQVQAVLGDFRGKKSASDAGFAAMVPVGSRLRQLPDGHRWSSGLQELGVGSASDPHFPEPSCISLSFLQ